MIFGDVLNLEILVYTPYMDSLSKNLWYQLEDGNGLLGVITNALQ